MCKLTYLQSLVNGHPRKLVLHCRLVEICHKNLPSGTVFHVQPINLFSFLQTPGAHEALSRRLVNMFMMIGLSVVSGWCFHKRRRVIVRTRITHMPCFLLFACVTHARRVIQLTQVPWATTIIMSVVSLVTPFIAAQGDIPGAFPGMSPWQHGYCQTSWRPGAREWVYIIPETTLNV